MATETTCQQFELYAAETTANLGRAIAPGALQAWVDDLRDLPYWQRNFPEVLRVECHVRRTDRDGSVGGWFPDDGCGQIEMAPCHLTELYVLHEVSHVLASARYSSRSHDPWFARTYLELVFARLGSEAFGALCGAFNARGIDHDTDNAVPGGVALGPGR